MSILLVFLVLLLPSLAMALASTHLAYGRARARGRAVVDFLRRGGHKHARRRTRARALDRVLDGFTE